MTGNKKQNASCSQQMSLIAEFRCRANHCKQLSTGWEFPPHQLRVLNIQVEYKLLLRDRACPTPAGPLSLSLVGPGTTLATS